MAAYVDSTGVTNLTADIKALADATYSVKLAILSYGNSTWQDFISAYNENAVVYCRASSNSNPASGSQTRMAFMAYVNNAASPTEVEFQYYRSIATHTNTQQGDQVFVYKLTSSGGGTWTVTTREAASKVAVGSGLSSSYSNGTLTLTADISALETALDLDEMFSVVISDTAPTNAHVNGWIDSDDVTFNTIPQIDDTQLSSTDTYSSSKINSTYLAYGVAQTLTETQLTQLYANMGFPSNTLGKLGYTVVT